MKVFVIAWTNLRRLANDRMTLFLTLALPVMIILIIGRATEGLIGLPPIGISAPSGDPLAAELMESIESDEVVPLERYADADDLRRDVRRGAVGSGVVIPSGYTDMLRSGGEPELIFIVDATRNLPFASRSIVGAAVAEQGASVQAARFATTRVGGTFEENLELARRRAAGAEGVGVSTQTIGEGEAISFGIGFEYQAHAQVVLFVFITSLAAAAQLIETRRLGVSRRMLSTPTRGVTILAGESLGRFAIALGQAVVILALGTLLFGVDWGDPFGAAALVGLFVLVGTGTGMLFGTVFRTPEQAGSIGPPVGIALGMLGGCMWPLEIVPEPMQAFGHLFPHAWAMDAWIDLTAFDRRIGGILPELAVLSGFALGLITLATWRLRRVLLAGG